MSKRAWLFLCFLSSFYFLSAQGHYLLDDFRAEKDNKRVILTWTIKKGGSCFGIGILRSTDKVNYEVIGEITGNCGSSSSAQSFSFIDENPVKNKVNYYILELGFSGKSDPPLQVKFIVAGDNGYKVIPNPVGTKALLYFENTEATLHTLLLWNISGKALSTFSSEKEYFELDMSEIIPVLTNSIFYQDNLYFFSIKNEQGKLITSGSFIHIQSN